MHIQVSALPGDGLRLDTQGRYELPGGGAAEDSASVLLTRVAGGPDGIFELRSGQSSGRAFQLGASRLVLCYEAEVRGQMERIVETFAREGSRIERSVVIEQAQRCLSAQDVLEREG